MADNKKEGRNMGTRTKRNAEVVALVVPEPSKIVDQIAKHLADDDWEFGVAENEIRLVVHADTFVSKPRLIHTCSGR
jgi:hypothetical protein